MTYTNHPLRLSLEMLLFFFGLPLLLAYVHIGRGFFLVLWPGSVLCYVLLRFEHGVNFAGEWNARAFCWAEVKPILQRFTVFALALVFFVWWFAPNLMFGLILHRTALWALVMVAYPLLSVIPQEIVYRSFFMTHFSPVFSRLSLLILADGLLFGWAHIVLYNWLAIGLSAGGGILFAQTYPKRRSLALCCFEHSIYGCFIFTLGLGRFFYNVV